MNTFRKAIGILLALLLAITALPVFAQNAGKTFRFLMERDSLQPSKVIAYISNMSIPSAQSNGTTNIGSLILSVDPASVGLQVADPTVPGNVTIQRLNGLIPDDGIITPTTFTPAGPITGVFSVLNTGTSSQLTIRSLSQPLKGQETLKVTITTLSCGFGTPWKVPQNSAGEYQVFNSGNLTGQTFTQVGSFNQTTDVSCAALACGGQGSASRVDDFQSDVAITRGPFNSDGACAGAPLTYINNRTAVGTDSVEGTSDDDKSVLLFWPFTGTDGLAEAAFRLDFNITSPQTPRVSWKNYKTTGGADTGIPAFLAVASDAALTCKPGGNGFVSTTLPQPDFFPRPFGKLAAAVLPTDTKVRITLGGTGSVPVPASLPANVIIQDELMIVTKMTAGNTTWTVTRPTPAAVTYPVDTLVMYTPLRTLSTASDPTCVGIGSASFACPYVKGELAKTCQIPGTTGTATSIMSIGDPIFSGGDI